MGFFGFFSTSPVALFKSIIMISSQLVYNPTSPAEKFRITPWRYTSGITVIKERKAGQTEVTWIKQESRFMFGNV